MVLLDEVIALTREHGDILARYHVHAMDDLDRIREECRRTAGERVQLEYIIRAKMMKAERIEDERSPGRSVARPGSALPLLWPRRQL
jgi:hypothetical protein